VDRLNVRLRQSASAKRIGIAWQGNPVYAADRRRSIPLQHFAPLAAVPGVQFVSLQKGHGAEQLAQAAFPFEDLGARLDNGVPAVFEVAAAMRSLDLVITSDTMIAHLAGALAVPVWVVLARPADWRWMLDRCDSPWYPTMRLFRQPKPGDWDGAMYEVRDALLAMLDQYD
jgi:hypothetical protein